ncbi:3,4-dihydroxy-2-butanone-4-phosphate synthase [Magnetospirillum aberrantis]|uniref:3,4-dihydroxy-2-butanone 4-phosphate synthase n=1 Tax=Magnetospirillum aberrantis SpK TaxID=908842 RepID=A0A7C9QS53_9PROT|nr:3,4-dihydroxy-2-butanone-4-phosphate synthase [Magnetospirillum aberrantis]NFV78957.1 3,4-dihydroxy-2-butanone-4-phosphate synthase [Magnetospirillum aberrantis SpK]
MSPSPIAAALAELRAGRPILVQDDADRENEADLICAAESVDDAIMARMIRDGSGIVCLCLTPAKAAELGLSPMVADNGSRYGTAFTQSIEARSGVTTGVSAADRVATIRAALASGNGDVRVVSPGHVFPLIARAGGVRERPGHTEASVELARLAGLTPAGVLCELMNPDGTMARGKQVTDYARLHGLVIVTIADLIAYVAERAAA